MNLQWLLYNQRFEQLPFSSSLSLIIESITRAYASIIVSRFPVRSIVNLDSSAVFDARLLCSPPRKSSPSRHVNMRTGWPDCPLPHWVRPRYGDFELNYILISIAPKLGREPGMNGFEASVPVSPPS